MSMKPKSLDDHKSSKRWHILILQRFFFMFFGILGGRFWYKYSKITWACVATAAQGAESTHTNAHYLICLSRGLSIKTKHKMSAKPCVGRALWSGSYQIFHLNFIFTNIYQSDWCSDPQWPPLSDVCFMYYWQLTWAVVEIYFIYVIQECNALMLQRTCWVHWAEVIKLQTHRLNHPRSVLLLTSFLLTYNEVIWLIGSYKNLHK